MVSLSYDYKGTKVEASRWEANDIREFMIKEKERLGERLSGYFWVCEMQNNGHPHYHILILAKGRIPKPDTEYKIGGRSYKRMWLKGSSSLSFKFNPYYPGEYLKKENQKNLDLYPKKCRMYGYWFRDPELKKMLGNILKAKMASSKDVYKAEGWKSDWEYLGSGYTKEYLQTIFGDR
jgi:hypothetical protein